MKKLLFHLFIKIARCALISLVIIMVGYTAPAQSVKEVQGRANMQKPTSFAEVLKKTPAENDAYTFSEDILPIQIKRISKKFDNYYRRRVAVCIGINEYKELPRLDSAVNDAKAMAGLFKGYNFDEVYLLTNERGTKRKIVNELLRFKGEAHENDLFVLYFAGHGATLKNAKNQDEGFLISVDTKKDNIYETGISMGLFKDIAESMPNKHMLFLVDCCYSGYGLTQGNIILTDVSSKRSNTIYLTPQSAGREIDVPNTSQIIIKEGQREGSSLLVEDYRPPKDIKRYLNQSISTPAVQILTAGGEGEEALETMDHGLFTERVIEVLKGETESGKDGVITAAEVAHYIRQQVSRESKGKQNPIYGYLKGNGDVLFITGQQENHRFETQRTLTLAEINELYIEANELKKKGEYLLADQMITKSYSHLKRHQTVEHKEILAYLKMLSFLAVQMHKIDMSVYYAQEIIAIADDEQDKSLGYNHLGNAYTNKGEYSRSIKYFEKSLSINQVLDNTSVISDYDNLGQAYEKKGDYDRAIGYFEKALKINGVKLGLDNARVATINNNLGVAYAKKGDSDRAIGYFEKALKINLAKLGPKHAYFGIAYGNLGSIYNEKGDYDSAIGYLEKSLEIEFITLGSEHPKIATCYNNLAQAYTGKGDYDRAIEYLEKSLKIILAKLGSEHPNVALVYTNIGVAYSKKGDYDSAIEYQEKALNIYLSKLGSEHLDIAKIYSNLGTAHIKKGNYDRAIKYLDKALNIIFTKLRSNHPSVANIYNSLGTAYYKKGVYDRAIENLEKAYETALNGLGESHPQTKLIKINLDSVKRKLKRS